MKTFKALSRFSLSIPVLIFALGCSSVPKTEAPKNWYSSYPQWPQIMTNYVAYGVSYPLAGAGYMVDGTIYFLGYVGVLGIACGPGLALGIAAGAGSAGGPGAPNNFNPCFFPVDHALRSLEREHPKLGRRIWRGTADWRHDPWDVYVRED